MAERNAWTLSKNIAEAEIRINSPDVRKDLVFFTKKLGFRLDKIYPADNPTVIIISGHGVRLRIEKGASEQPGMLRILCEDPQNFAAGETTLTAPNGMRIEIGKIDPPMVTPKTEHSFVVRHLRDKASWVIGRAGMN